MLSKILKKIAGIYGFKLIDKDLIKNNRLIAESNLYSLQDILESLFKNKIINQLIQIGSNDGKRFDIINEYIKIYSPNCVLVEPIKTYFDQLKQNYNQQKNIKFENLAISVNNEVNFLFKVKESKTKYYDEHIKGITSFDKKHLKKHGVKSSHIEIEKVKNISINNLIEKYENKVDLLIIDAEGYDGNIVIDLLENSNIQPIIIYEYIHVKFNIFSHLIELLKDKKYSYFNIDENLICLPNKMNIKSDLDIHYPI